MRSGKLTRLTDDECLLANINNLTLYNLGVALIAIERWQEFNPDDVLSVKKAARSSMFGSKYQHIVRKCLGSEFRYGHDLSKPKMHREAYETVVGTLEDLIASLSIQDDG